MTHTVDDTDVLVISQFYRPETIGSGPFCADLAESIAAAGRQVKVITARPHYPDNIVFPPYRDGTRDRQFINSVEINRVPIFAHGRDSVLCRLLGEGSMLLGAGAVLMRDGARRAPIIVSLCPSIFSVILATMVRRKDARSIAIVHDIQSGMAEGLGVAGRALVRVLRRIERIAFNRCDLIIVLSEEMRKCLREADVNRTIEVHPIWIDTDAIQPRPGLRGPARTALYSGNFGRKQGLHQLVDLAQELRGRGSDLRVHLRGRGSQKELIRRVVMDRGLHNVEFHDLIGPERFAEGLAEGDIHLVPQDPSVADYAVPSKIYSIMAAGRPFVATARKNSTLWRLREESDAFLCVPPDDARTFANTVLERAADPAQRASLGQRGRDYVMQHCSKTRSLERLMSAIADGRRADELHAW